MQTQTSITLHNAIMEAGSKDRLPMLAPGIDNDIYSTVDACPNACETWKEIERLKQGESINVQDLETNLFGNLENSHLRMDSMYNYKELGHVARECQKPKRAKDAAYHREKMLMCKQEEARIQLNAKQADWRDDIDDDELEDQELEAHYMYMAQLQEVSPDAADSGPIFDDEPLQK
nr:hypothetical protein [Tanacetum cinerariifolium]